ncbi:ArgE/DapE family deacylase [Lactobacillus sp. CC-MHH1034]|uniref:ArgE/DapE family deacylase n=1 Tax=Agrilactobacillus fermenti TaxID=2586909 RepID=UPI001E4AD751|nr:ArgE/DapE family deacylase [Agrilactobacillus fermenti]MCD2256604.1 ArgE/DapE family deacylase [Agrilactobacillus fermenti]
MDEQQKMAILEKLISIQSVNDHELTVAQYLKTLLDQAGIENEIRPINDTRANLVATLGSGKPILAISGHMDVVAVDRDNWQTDPFKLTQKEDLLYGRGVTDMKSGLAALIIAMIELKEKHVPIKGTIRLLATAGEEVGQLGAETLTSDGFMKDVDTLLIAEPSGYRAVYANKGELDLTITSKGKAAHSSMPKLGNNAVQHLMNVLAQLQAKVTTLMQDKRNSVLGETVYNLDVIKGGNQVNAITSLATAQINIRTIPELPNTEILKTMNAVIADYNQKTNGAVGLKVDMDIVPIIGKENAKIIQLIKQIAEPYMAKQQLPAADIAQGERAAQATGMSFSADKILTMGVSGGTDASKFLIDHQQDFNYVVFGPGNDTPHQDNESIAKQMYFDFIAIYEQLLPAYFEA